MANLRTDNLSGEGGRNAIKGSVFFAGGNDALVIPASSDFAYGTGDFTIEAWIWKAGVPATGETRGIFTQTQSGNDYIVFKIGSSNNIQATFGSTTISSTGTLAVHSWNHVAVSRSSNTVKVFLNGIASSGSTVSTDFSDTTRNPTIGNYTHSYGSLDYNGYISNLRVCKGHAVYTADFTPPSSPLSVHDIADDDKTVLLCCQDSDNPLQEATGKTITASGNLVEGDDTELITNGGFTADISGWTASGVQWSHSSGALMHFGNGNTQRNIYQDVTTVIGRKYVFRVEASSAEASTAYWQVVGDSDLAGNNYIADNNNAAPLEYVFYFTADSTTTKIRFYSYDSSNSSNVRSYWYRASLKLAPRPKSPKVIPPYGVDAGNTFGGAISMNSSAWMYFPTGRTEERSRGRAVIGWANNPVNTGMDVFNIQSMGNSTVFGNLTTGNKWGSHAFSSTTRGLWAGGYINTPAATFFNTIEFVTIATNGNPIDFGDTTTAPYRSGCCSSSTRGLIALGYVAPNFSIVNTIDQVTIASLGNATNFGDLFQTRANMSSLSSPTRGIFAGGVTPANQVTIDFVTIASAGDAQDFGDLQAAVDSSMALASNTRGIIGGGYPSPANTNIINFITIASAGNAQDFGDLTGLYSVGSATSNNTRGVFCGGYTAPSKHNLMEFVTITTTGNASDFGDITYTRRDFGACSDSHGGLS